MFGHCYLDNKYCFWFYAFHMALFFILHGYTTSLKTESYLIYVKKKIKSILVPYVFFALATILIDYILAVTHGRTYSIIGVIMQYALQQRYTLLWYLICMFVADQIIYVLKRSNIDSKNRWLASSAGFFLLFFIYHYTIGVSLLWNIDLALLAVSFMSFGVYMRQKIVFAEIKPKLLYIIVGLCAVWLTTSIINFIMYGFVDWYNNAFGNPLLFLCGAVGGSLFVMAASPYIDIRPFEIIGRDSMLFYGLHRIIIDLSFSLYGKLGIEIVEGSISSVAFALVSVALAIAVLWPINWIIQRICPWVVGRKVKTVG